MSDWQGRPGADKAFEVPSLVNGVCVPRARPVSMAPSVGMHANTGTELKARKESPGSTFCARVGGPEMMRPPKGKPDTERQKAMLDFVVGCPGIDTKALAEKMGMDVISTARMLSRLVGKGLVQDRGTKSRAKKWHPL